MGGRILARRSNRGGELIQAARQIGARLALALPAVALLAAVVVYSALEGDRLSEVVAGVGAAGCALFVLGLVGRWPSLLVLGLGGVGAGYAVFLSLRSGGVDANSPLFGAALFVAAELGLWSLEPRLRAGAAVLIRRVLMISMFALGSALVGSLILVASAGVSGGVGLEALGVLAAVAVLALIAALAARARGSTST